MPDDRDKLDRLLDSALANYADPGPDSGLEKRILNRVVAEAAPEPRRRWMAWAIALPVAAVVLLFVLLSHPGANRQPGTPQANVVQRPVAPSIDAANRLSGRPSPIRRSETPLHEPHLRRKTLAAKSAPLPKLDVFPTPQPLSPEEQALVNFAARATKSEREALVAAQRETDTPLSISAIEIKPLEPPASGAN